MLYEQAFGTKADILFINDKGDCSVGHAEMRINGVRIMLKDRFGKKDKTTDCAAALILTFESAAESPACYEMLRPAVL